jgi:glucose/arabinose dehydrogenase
VPDGFSLELLTKDLPGARVIAKDGLGNYWVSQPSSGRVSQLEMEDGVVKRINAIFRGLKRPHGIAIDPASNSMILYIAEEHRIVRAHLYSDAPLETVAMLPGIGRHWTRTLGFGPDGRLYVSIGSTCDVCEEENEEHAAILSMKTDGSDRRIVAQGLRNAVFFAWHPQHKNMWATDMGRDRLGDHLPPEEVNVIQEGAHYGWPFCYGDRVRDQTFSSAKTFDCAQTHPPAATLPAHIAPLGLAFIPPSWGSSAGDLLVAAHGSWNSSVPVGYKIFRIPLSSGNQQEEEATPFIDGWMQNGTALGRPVHLFMDGDQLLITDDKLGAVYRLKTL